LPFPITIPPKRQNPYLVEQLVKELEGILNWALVGAVRLHALGRFTIPEASRLAHEEFRLEANPARAWLIEHCEADPEGQVEASQLYSMYVRYCQDSGFHPLNRTNFQKEVERVFPMVKEARARQVQGQPRPRVLKGIRERVNEGDDDVAPGHRFHRRV
jgi:putative DNA primase/helicase